MSAYVALRRPQPEAIVTWFVTGFMPSSERQSILFDRNQGVNMAPQFSHFPLQVIMKCERTRVHSLDDRHAAGRINHQNFSIAVDETPEHIR